jgi:hypothetical protein
MDLYIWIAKNWRRRRRFCTTWRRALHSQRNRFPNREYVHDMTWHDVLDICSSFVRKREFMPVKSLNKSHHSSVGMALGYGLNDRGSRVQFPAEAGNFLFTTASRTALGPTQPSIQWIPGALSLGVKRPGREADHSPPSTAEVKEWVELYLHSPVHLHGVVLS